MPGWDVSSERRRDGLWTGNALRGVVEVEGRVKVVAAPGFWAWAGGGHLPDEHQDVC